VVLPHLHAKRDTGNVELRISVPYRAVRDIRGRQPREHCVKALVLRRAPLELVPERLQLTLGHDRDGRAGAPMADAVLALEEFCSLLPAEKVNENVRIEYELFARELHASSLSAAKTCSSSSSPGHCPKYDERSSTGSVSCWPISARGVRVHRMSRIVAGP